MRTVIKCCLLGFFFSWCSRASHAQELIHLFSLKKETRDLPEGFSIDLQVRQLEKSKLELVSTLDLKKGAYIISPFSQDEFYLNYTCSLEENSILRASSKMIEFPASSLEMDTIIETEVRFVRNTTRFSQEYYYEAKEDFVVSGLIEFLVEPSCIPWDITFDIERKDGVLSIENINKSISTEYKR